MEPPAIWSHFENLKDPRVERTRRHQLIDIVIISVLAVVAGADGWSDIVQFAEDRQDWFKTFLELPAGIPCDDTFRRVFAALDPVKFQAGFLSWAKCLVGSTEGQLVAIDGKTARHSFASEQDQGALHIVSAWAAQHQVVLGQLATEAKSNEITAIPQLLEMLDLKGATVTIDAMGCQKKIAEKIVSGKADYILSLKENQPSLHREAQEFFASAESDGYRDVRSDYEQSVDGGHGRIEVRRVRVSDDIDWMSEKAQWKGLRTIVMVESERTVGQDTSIERRYYITSLVADAALVGSRIRGHWGIENSLHWVLDMAFDEDRCRIRRGNGPDNFALLRKIAVNLLKAEKTCKRGVEGKRKHAAWNNDYLLRVLEAGAKLAVQ
jgi:predicted transposase YbfD/YdcC